MAKTILTLFLNYKGKDLDVIKHGRHFTNKWFIGSNKFLQWQILDPSFPDKLQLISQKGDSLFLNLVNPNQLSCSQNGKEVDNAQLKSNGILRGNELELRNDMSGTVNLIPDWQIRFMYTEPWVRVLTHEEQQIVAQYSRRSEGTAQERFSRNLMILAVLISGVFLVGYDLFLKPVTSTAGTLEAKLAQFQKAERILPSDLPTTNTGMTDAEMAAADAAAKAEAAAQAAANAAAARAAAQVNAGRTRPGTGTGTPGATRTASSVFGDFTGGGGTPGGTRTSTVVASVSRTFTAASRNGGGGGGTGPGPGGSGGGTGVGNPSSFNPGAISGYNQSVMGGAVTGTGSIKGSTAIPTGEAVSVATGGNLANLAPKGRPVAQSGADRAAMNTFTAANVSTKTEASIQSAPEADRPDLQKIAASVNTRKGQVEQLYRRAAAIKATSGSVKIRLYIGADGRVKTAVVTPTTEGFTEQFLRDLKNMVQGWTFPISSQQVYEFTYRLSQ